MTSAALRSGVVLARPASVDCRDLESEAASPRAHTASCTCTPALQDSARPTASTLDGRGEVADASAVGPPAATHDVAYTSKRFFVLNRGVDASPGRAHSVSGSGRQIAPRP